MDINRIELCYKEAFTSFINEIYLLKEVKEINLSKIEIEQLLLEGKTNKNLIKSKRKVSFITPTELHQKSINRKYKIFKLNINPYELFLKLTRVPPVVYTYFDNALKKENEIFSLKKCIFLDFDNTINSKLRSMYLQYREFFLTMYEFYYTTQSFSNITLKKNRNEKINNMNVLYISTIIFYNLLECYQDITSRIKYLKMLNNKKFFLVAIYSIASDYVDAVYYAYHVKQLKIDTGNPNDIKTYRIMILNKLKFVIPSINILTFLEIFLEGIVLDEIIKDKIYNKSLELFWMMEGFFSYSISALAIIEMILDKNYFSLIPNDDERMKLKNIDLNPCKNFINNYEVQNFPD